jgi:uncharacterized membrane protein YidH (DUF202 family)
MMYGGVFGIVALICAVWVIYDVFNAQKKMDSATKVIWTIAAIVLNILTAIVYYFFVYSKKGKK